MSKWGGYYETGSEGTLHGLKQGVKGKFKNLVQRRMGSDNNLSTIRKMGSEGSRKYKRFIFSSMLLHE